jgi:hypothetical protein
VRETNYLDVFRYEKWNAKSIPVFEKGQTFVPATCLINQVDNSTTQHIDFVYVTIGHNPCSSSAV